MDRFKKILISALAVAALGAVLPGATMDAPSDDIVVRFIKWYFKTAAEMIAEKARAAIGSTSAKAMAAVEKDAKDFQALHAYDLVITNQGQGAWTFGITDKFPGQLKDEQSGTLKVAMLKPDGDGTYPPVEVTPSSGPVAMNDFYGVWVVTPVCAKKNTFSSQKFARVCYLEDSNRRRIYLTLTKDTSSTAVPVVGVAAMSNQMLYEQKPIHFNDPQFKNFNMIGIQVDKIK